MGLMCDQFVGLLCDQFHHEFDTGEIWPIFFLIIPNDFRSLQENGRGKLVGVERLTTTRLSTTKVIVKYQQNQRDQIETKTCSTTTLWQKCYKSVTKMQG